VLVYIHNLSTTYNYNNLRSNWQKLKNQIRIDVISDKGKLKMLKGTLGDLRMNIRNIPLTKIHIKIPFFSNFSLQIDP